MPPEPVLQHDLHLARERGQRHMGAAPAPSEPSPSLSRGPLLEEALHRGLSELMSQLYGLGGDLISHSLGFIIYKRALVTESTPELLHGLHELVGMKHRTKYVALLFGPSLVSTVM